MSIPAPSPVVSAHDPTPEPAPVYAVLRLGEGFTATPVLTRDERWIACLFEATAEEAEVMLQALNGLSARPPEQVPVPTSLHTLRTSVSVPRSVPPRE